MSCIIKVNYKIIAIFISSWQFYWSALNNLFINIYVFLYHTCCYLTEKIPFMKTTFNIKRGSWNEMADGYWSGKSYNCTTVVCTSACNHPTRNNESTYLFIPSRACLHTTFTFQSQSQCRPIYAVTIRSKSLYEDVHASTGHPGYTGMQWHQKNTIGANYTDKDAGAPRGICQGCALGSAHQYPTNQHYVMTDKPNDNNLLSMHSPITA